MLKSFDLIQETYDKHVEVAINAAFDRNALTAIKLNNLVVQWLNPGAAGIAATLEQGGAKSKDQQPVWTQNMVISVQLVAKRKGVEVGVISSATWIICGGSGSVDEFKVGYEIIQNPVIVSDELVLRLATQNINYALELRAFVDSEVVKVKEADYVAAGFQSAAQPAQVAGFDQVFIGSQFDAPGS